MSEPAIQHIERNVRELSARVTRLEADTGATRVHRENVERRLSSIENSITWVLRTVVGAVLLALIAFIINGGIAI